MAAPLIAITTSELRDANGAVPTPEGEPAQQEMVLGMKYLSAIERAGGVPLVVPPLHDPALLAALLDHVGGLVLSGGPDLDPVTYGAERHGRLGPTWRALDEPELTLARLADERGLPILGICRGLQTLNVARGGTLHQHLPERVGEEIAHRQQAAGSLPTHRVTLDGDCRLAEIVGATELAVNSFHHQGIDTLGGGLRATGFAPDGTLESVEALDRDFVLGVQWHAECLIDDDRQSALFAALVAAADRYAATPQSLRQAA
jgi:putative glutamine amidotransferase